MRNLLIFIIITLFNIGPDRIGYGGGLLYVLAINRESDASRINKGNLIQNYLNETIDPCEDFYEYSCGNWDKHHRTRPLSLSLNRHMTMTTIATSQFNELSNKVEMEIQELLAEPLTIHDKNIHRKVKDFYTSCMNINQIQQIGKQPYLQFIEMNGGMPAINSQWNETTFNWLTSISKLKAGYGINILFHLDILSDYQNNKENRVYLGKPQNFAIIDIKEFLLENPKKTRQLRDKYKIKLSKDLHKFFNIENSKTDRIATEMVDFEIRLAKAANDFPDQFEFVSLNYLSDKYRGLDFNNYITTSLSLPVRSSLYIYATSTNYITNLLRLINETPKRIVANYIMWSAISKLLFSNETNVEKRSKLCTTKTTEMFTKIIGTMFYRKYFVNNTKDEIEEICDYLKKSFSEILGNVNWLEQSLKIIAQYKLTNMRMHLISYDLDVLEKDYMALTINRDKFFYNIVNLLAFDQNNMRNKLFAPLKPYSMKDIETSSTNAIYVTTENLIKIPLGLLQPPFYNLYYPFSIKFGQIGSLIGHEIMHGFDINGQKFDQFGNMKNWWDDDSTEKFSNRSDCFIQQYDDFKVDGKPLQGNDFVIDENIANSVGVKIAFKSYLEWLRITTNLEDLRKETLSVDFSNTQLFFISYAQMYCTTKNSNDTSLNINLIDQYGNAKFRVNGILSNFDEFTKEFNCPPGSPMNRADKCIIY